MMGCTREILRRNTNRGMASIATVGLVLGTMAPTAFAATQSPTWAKKNIEFSSYTAMNVSGYVAGGTTYMPIWYVLQALKKSGYQYSFDGKVLNIDAPSGVTPNTSRLPLGSGNLTLSINGNPVQKVNSQVYRDPAGTVQTQYIPIYYIQQILSALSFYNQWDGTNWTGQQVMAAIVGSNNVEVGQQDALALTLSDPNGDALIPSGNVTWSVNGGGSSMNGATIDQTTGIFEASAAGMYQVTASIHGFPAITQQVLVYGQATGVKLTASTSTLVADGAATDTVTVQATDANGNVIPTFNGQVTLSSQTTGGSFVGGTVSGNTNSIPVYITNGSGTATLTAPTTNPGLTELIGTSDLTSMNQSVAANVAYSSLAISYVAPTAASILITPNISAVSATGSNADYLTATLNDSAGNPLGSAYGAPVYVTFNLSGPGSFQYGTTTPVTTYSQYVYPGSTGITLPVYSIANQPGTLTVTATGGGLSGSATITSELSTAASGIRLTSQPGTLLYPAAVGNTTLLAGTTFTLYTAQLVDHNGNPVPQQDTLSISDNMYNAANTPPGKLYYYGVSLGQPAYPLTGTAGVYPGQTAAATGQFQFIVMNTTSSATPADITVTDQSTGSSTTTPYLFH